jgi:gliding motility-associated-like protein
MTPANNNQTFNTCNGFLIDSGGQGGTGYGNNESIVITICPDTPGEIISIVFNLFALDPTNTGTNQNPNIDNMSVYDGTSTASPTLGTYTGNQLQGVVIEATVLNPTGCITLEFYSNAVNTGQFTASISCETPCADPQAGGIVLNGITNDSIRACVGDTITFQEQGSFAQMGFNLVNYQWDFLDGDTANGTTVQHVYDVPGFYNVQLFVTDDNGCTNPNLIELRVLVGTIPDFTGFPSDTSICLGESMEFVADPEAYQVSWNGFPGSQQIDDGCLPDTLLGVSQDVTLLQTGFAAGTTIQNVNDIQSICLDLEHSFMGDLVILVECPNGQSSILHQQGGGGTQLGIPNPLDNVDCTDPSTQGVPFTYCFTPQSTETWVDWVAAQGGFGLTLPAGNYASIQPLNNLVGCPTNGVWTLTVIDNWAADDGTLFGFSLTLDPSYYPPPQTFEPLIGLGSDSSYWDNPIFETFLDPLADSLIVTPTQSGAFTYQYFVFDNFGCEYDTSVVLYVDPLSPTFAGNDTSLCDNVTLNLNGQVTGLTSSCNYTLTMEDAAFDAWNGSLLTITVNGVPTVYNCTNPSIQIENLVIPAGANVTVSFDAAGAWPGECSYTIEDPNGVVLVSQGPGLNAVTVDNFIANCVPTYEYAWTPQVSVSDPTIADPTFTGAGSQQLILTTFPVGHPLCATTDTVLVTVSQSPYPGEDTTIFICPTAAALDLFPLLGPNVSIMGSWFDDQGNPIVMPYDPAVSPAGDYTYQTDSLGCTDEAVVTVVFTPTTIDNIIITDALCNGASDGTITITGTNMVEYTVDGGTPIVAASPFTINGLPTGTYTVAIFSADGCADSADIVVGEPAVLQVSAVPTDATCFGDCDGQVQINVVGGTTPYTYVWIPGTNGNQAGLGLDLCAGPYITGVIDANGCADSVSYIINEPPPLEPAVMGDVLSGCFPHTVNFTNTTPGAVTSTDVDYGDGTVETVSGTNAFTHEYATPGTYTVTITVYNANNCSYSVTYTNYVTVYGNPNANFTINPNNISMLEPTTSLINTSSSDVVSWDWQITNGEPSQSTNEDVSPINFPFDQPGDYPITLTVTNAAGCIDSVTYNVSIVSDVLIFAPNTFTPDNDEFNQSWVIFMSGIDIFDFELVLYNRWGEIVWESRDVSVGWDGTYNGKPVQDGTYTWFVKCADLTNDKKYEFQGHVNVIR